MFWTQLIGFLKNGIFITRFVIQAVCCMLVLRFPGNPAKWENPWKKLLFLFLQIAGIFAAEVVINALFITITYCWVIRFPNFFLADLVVVFGYCALFSRCPWKNRLILASVLYVSFILVSEFGSKFAEILTGNINAGSENMVTIVSYVLVLLISLVLCRFTISDIGEIPFSYFSLLELQILISVFVPYYYIICIAAVNGMTIDPYYAVTLFALYVIDIVGYSFLRIAVKERSEKILALREKERTEQISALVQLSEQSVQNMREIRHDYKNQIGTMRVLLKENRYDELERYFAAFSAESIESISLIDSGNRYIDAVLNMENSRAKSRGVPFGCTLRIPQELPFSETDLTGLLSNLVDNAIEAVARSGEEGRADLDVFYNGEYLCVCCRNTIAADADRKRLLEMRTEKTDAENHGIGHRIVDKIVLKYNGSVLYEIEGNEFCVKAMLEKPAGQE